MVLSRVAYRYTLVASLISMSGCFYSNQICNNPGADDARWVRVYDNDEPVITDTTSNLMWEGDYQTDISWYAAVSYCEALTFGGYDDWRVPTANELYTLHDDDAEDRERNSSFPCTPKYYWNQRFWSSLQSSDGNEAVVDGKAEFVSREAIVWDFSDRAAGPLDKASEESIRCVRSTTDYVMPECTNFGAYFSRWLKETTANGDKTVIDTTNVSSVKRVWAASYATNKTFDQATSYCNDLVYAGRSNWRLPTRDESYTILATNVASVQSSFPCMPNAAFWYDGGAISYEWPIPDREYGSNNGARNFTTSNETPLYVRCVADRDTN